jgi:hypothetical protein
LSYPEHPNTTVIQNQYYPGGLTELRIWNHYKKFKDRIINEIDGNAVAMWIFTDINDSIVKRKVLGSPFTINKNNYDKVITGRTVSLSSELKSSTDNIIIDVDPGSNINEFQLKECIRNILDSSISSMNIIKDRRIVSTANGYHIYFKLNKTMNISSIKSITLKYLTIDFRDMYLINTKNPKPNEINLDLTPITPRGLHQTPYALCRNGLMAMDVTDFLTSFNRRSSIIK